MKLIYVHDPMCSWCWAFRPVWLRLKAELSPGIVTQGLLGGLAPDSEVPMPEATRAYVIGNWKRIQEVVPDARFNFEFWTRCKPRRSTYPACRAVIAASDQGSEHEEPMVEAIQQAYYLQARNPSDTDTLMALAVEIDLDTERFASTLHSAATQAELLRQIALSRQLGAHGFPSLIVQDGVANRVLQIDYQDEDRMLSQINSFV
jgi:putative protein-disulfide isomerase